MTLLTDASPIPFPNSVSVEGGDLFLGVAPLFPPEEPRWCSNCGGMQTFVPVDRFIGGWRGWCRGCEEVKYVMVSRSESEEE